MFLRELEGEVLENIALRSLIRDIYNFGFLDRFNWRELLNAREGLFRIFEF